MVVNVVIRMMFYGYDWYNCCYHIYDYYEYDYVVDVVVVMICGISSISSTTITMLTITTSIIILSRSTSIFCRWQ